MARLDTTIRLTLCDDNGHRIHAETLSGYNSECLSWRERRGTELACQFPRVRQHVDIHSSTEGKPQTAHRLTPVRLLGAML